MDSEKFYKRLLYIFNWALKLSHVSLYVIYNILFLELSDAASVAFHVKVSHVDDQYRQIDEVVAAQPCGESVLFDEHLHLLKPFTNRMQRMRFFEDLHLSVDVDMSKETVCK